MWFSCDVISHVKFVSCEWINERAGGRTGGQAGGWTDGRMDKQTIKKSWKKKIASSIMLSVLFNWEIHVYALRVFISWFIFTLEVSISAGGKHFAKKVTPPEICWQFLHLEGESQKIRLDWGMLGGRLEHVALPNPMHSCLHPWCSKWIKVDQ